MIELIVGGFIYYVINTIEKDREQMQLVKKMKEKYFTDDRPKYYTSL
jgi:hypothetical protein